MFDMAKMSHNLKNWRTYRRLTLEKLAEMANTSKGQISALENGTRNLNQLMTERLALALQCPPEDLISVNPFARATVVNHTQILPASGEHGLLLTREKRSVPVSFNLDTRGWTVAGVSHPAVRRFAYIDESYADIDVTAWPIKDKSINKLYGNANTALSVPLSARAVGDGSLVIIQRTREFEGVTEYKTLIRMISVQPNGAIIYITQSDDPDLQEPIARDDSVWRVIGAVIAVHYEMALPERPITFN